MKTICGADCKACGFKETCSGCMETGGRPFGDICMLAECCKSKGKVYCKECSQEDCAYKNELIKEFNALNIADMAEVKNLNALKGSFVNLEYQLASGQNAKFWNDNKIYLGNQICKKNSSRCYGIIADENYLFVCEYGDNGENPEIIVFKKRNI